MYNVWRPLARRCQLLWNSGISLQPGSLILDTHRVSLTGFSIGLGQLNNLYAMKTQCRQAALFGSRHCSLVAQLINKPPSGSLPSNSRIHPKIHVKGNRESRYFYLSLLTKRVGCPSAHTSIIRLGVRHGGKRRISVREGKRRESLRQEEVIYHFASKSRVRKTS
jgi:hypothetical protein